MRKTLEKLFFGLVMAALAAVILGLAYLSGREVVRSVTMIYEGTLVVPDDSMSGPGNLGAVFKRAVAKSLYYAAGIREETTIVWLQGIYAAFMSFVTLSILLAPLILAANAANKKGQQAS